MDGPFSQVLLCSAQPLSSLADKQVLTSSSRFIHSASKRVSGKTAVGVAAARVSKFSQFYAGTFAGVLQAKRPI